MKVTIKRPIAGTVPRKLELVNVSCVWRYTASERSIVVSQDRAPIHISFLARGGEAEMPPFWELEALIDQGFEHDLALDIMAARRGQALPSVAVSPAPPVAIASQPETDSVPLTLAPAHL
jgi:hypothetical protein